MSSYNNCAFKSAFQRTEQTSKQNPPMNSHLSLKNFYQIGHRLFWTQMWLSLLFSRPVVSDSFRPHGLQHARPPCPSASPGVCLSSCWLHRWCCPAISSSDALFSCPQIFPSIRDFSSESTVHIRWPKYCSFSFNISPSSEYSGLISFRTVWFGLLAVQGTLRSLLQHHGLKASILRHSAFFMVQLSHPMAPGKTTALTVWTSVGRVMCLILNPLSTFVIAFLPRSSHLLISRLSHRLQWFWAQEEDLCHRFHHFPFYLPRSDGADAMILAFLKYLILSQLFHSPTSPSLRGSLVPLRFLPLEWYHLHIWGCWCFSRLS